MADIRSIGGLQHLRGTSTAHILHMRRGKVVHSGTGQSFWFRPLSAVLSEIPVDDRELPVIFRAHTVDFQQVAVQATVTFRVSQPDIAASRVDFSIDLPRSGTWVAAPVQQLSGLLTESAQQHAVDFLSHMALRDVLVDGIAAVRQSIMSGLANDSRIADTGLDVIGVRVIAIRPEPDVEKALQTPTREQVQQEADRATFERRALAVERERAIGENEMQTQIELARREEQLVAQQGTNARRKAEEAAAATRIETESQADRETRLTQVRADGTKVMGDAKASAEQAWLAAYRDLGQSTLMGLAVKELAMNLPKIQSLVLTPDLLAPLLAKLGTTPVASTNSEQ